MQLHSILTLVQNDFHQVNETILHALSSTIPLINNISAHIIESGGKRLRPLVVLLTARACGYTQGNAHITLAAIIEFIHTATLLHDDVVDASDKRRGRPTANHVWGNCASVLVGDFLYSRSFQMMASLARPEVMCILADATNIIAEGEVLQLAHRHKPETNEQDYYQIIDYKTAKLFEAAAALGAVLSEPQDPDKTAALSTYGRELGLAFQLVDDVMDYTADSNTMGKNLGDDLAEGKVTLPVIYALKHSPAPEANRIRTAITQGGLDNLAEIQDIIMSSGGIDYTQQAAKKHVQLAQQALSTLPESAYKQALIALADFAISRKN